MLPNPAGGSSRYLALLAPSAKYSHNFAPSRMVLARSLFICWFCLLFCRIAAAQDNFDPKSSDANKTVLPAIPSTSPGPPITFSSVHVDGPFIALTFDDGPSEKLTPKLLDLLAAHRIKATFFVIGENVARYPEILRRAAREGHEIGNHSWSHPSFGKMSDEGVRRELQKTDDAITAATGVHPTLVRPPYGSITAREKRWIHDEFGYRIVLWDVDPLDWKRPGPSVVTKRILKETHDGSIVLSHDIHPATIEAMPATLTELEAKGFKFVTVSELIAMARPPKAKVISQPASAAHTHTTAAPEKPTFPVTPTPAKRSPEG